MTRLHRMLAFVPLAALVACEPATTEPTMQVAAPTLARSANAPVHRVTGGGKLDISAFDPTLPPETYGFTASVDGNGNVKGQLQADFSAPDVTFHMEITCLSVNGNNAWMGGTVTQTHDATIIPVGTHFFVQVQDNGEGNAAAPDRMSFFFFVGNPAVCNAQLTFGLPFAWLHGNIQVE